MTGTDISYAVKLLQQGEVVAIPTETVYGLAANAYDPDAVLKIYQIKNRPHFNPLILHTDNIKKIEFLTTAFPDALKSIATRFWPGPLTVLLPKSKKIHDIVTAGSDLVAVRIPDHNMTLKILSEIDFPLAAPSANPFGYISPTSAEHVEKQLGDKIPYIINGGPCSVGVESTIIKLNEENKIEILRTGGVTIEQIEAITGYAPVINNYALQPEAPGMLKSHYAPKIPLIAGELEKLIADHRSKKIALLTFNRTLQHPSIIFQIALSEKGDMQEAAKNLFSALHALDKSGAEIIIVENVPDIGIGKAINDRLNRAASNS